MNVEFNFEYCTDGESFHDLKKGGRSFLNMTISILEYSRANVTERIPSAADCVRCGFMDNSIFTLDFKDRIDVSHCDYVITTMIFGEYDHLNPLPNGTFAPKKSCSFFFTDIPGKSMPSPEIKPEDFGYTVIHVKVSKDYIPFSIKRLGKIFKIIPHRIFKNLKWHIFLAGKTRIESMSPLLMQILQNGTKSLYIEHHPSKLLGTGPFLSSAGVYEEGALILKNQKEDPKLVQEKLEYFRSQGLPNRTGMIDGHFIIRNFQDVRVRELSCAWFHEIVNGSSRDQLSFNYVLWKKNLEHIVRPLKWKDLSKDNRHVHG